MEKWENAQEQVIISLSTALLAAVEEGCESVAKEILEQITIANKEHYKILHTAIILGNQTVVQGLLDRNIPLDAEILQSAVVYGNDKILGILLDTTVDVNIVDEYGEGALHWAESAQGSRHAVKLLLDTGADANRVTKYGWTPRSVALNRNCDLTTITIPLIS